jgi:hypothetical protein
MLMVGNCSAHTSSTFCSSPALTASANSLRSPLAPQTVLPIIRPPPRWDVSQLGARHTLSGAGCAYRPRLMSRVVRLQSLTTLQLQMTVRAVLQTVLFRARPAFINLAGSSARDFRNNATATELPNCFANRRAHCTHKRNETPSMCAPNHRGFAMTFNRQAISTYDIPGCCTVQLRRATS